MAENDELRAAECPVCHGEGRFQYGFGQPLQRCRRCEGNGRVPTVELDGPKPLPVIAAARPADSP